MIRNNNNNNNNSLGGHEFIRYSKITMLNTQYNFFTILTLFFK